MNEKRPGQSCPLEDILEILFVGIDRQEKPGSRKMY